MRILSRSLRSSARRKGLTLIEILVVSVIFAILAAALFAVFKAGLDSWRRTQAHLEVFQNARAALNMMTSELPATYLNISNATITFRGFAGAAPSGWVSPSGGSEVFFIAALNPSLNYSDAAFELCKVGYYLDATSNTLMRYSHYNKVGATPDFDFSHNAGSDNVTFTKVASNITGFVLRYVDETGALLTKWDSTDPALTTNFNKKPKEVFIVLTVREPNSTKTPQTFTGAICIPQ